MAINAQNRSLPDWFTRIRTRQTVLPRFQRFEAWEYGKVTQLFNTILRGLPVGASLVLEIGNEEPFVSRPLKGAPEKGERVTEHLLDGQQRLTALWRGLHNNYEDRTYFLCLEKDDETGMPYYVESVARWTKEGETERRPVWANAAKKLWQRRMIPLDLLAPAIDLQALRAWVKDAIEDRDEQDMVIDQAVKVREALATFNLPFLSLPAATDKETALDVFMKMNTSAAPLTTYDIVVAQVEASMGRSLHDLVANIREKCSAIAAYYPPENLALYSCALIQGKAPTNKTYLAREFGQQLLKTWDTFLKGINRSVAFLEEERIYDAPRLATDVVIPVLVALWSLVPDGLDAEGRARSILRKYVWRAFFSARYEKSTNSRALSDFNELKDLISGQNVSPAIFDDTKFPLPAEQELLGAGWPKKTDRLARAITALALKQGGHDLADGSAVTRANLAKREYHHLFPDAHLRRIGIEDDDEIYKSLNCAVVTWRTNRNISDKDPERYLAERREGTDLGEAEIRSRLATHLIPYDEMIAGNYQAFLHRRASLIFDEMTRVCDGPGRVTPPGAVAA